MLSIKIFDILEVFKKRLPLDKARAPPNDTCFDTRSYDENSDYESILQIDHINEATNGTKYKCIATNTQG